MNINPFELERYFAKYEFNAPYLLSCSDCESLSVSDLVNAADKESADIWNNLKLGYTESKGNPLLRCEISKLYKGIVEENILCTVPEEGIYISMRSLLEKGDEVIYTFPGYQSLYEVANSQGAHIKKWEVRYNNGWYFDVEDLKAMVSKNTKMIVVNFPHNPTGAAINKQELLEIVDIAKENDCILFCDEMYRYLEYDEKDRLPSVCEIYDKGIALCGLSKSFSCPGLRIGWLITKSQDMMQKLASYKDYTTICLSAPSEVLGIMVLRQKEEIVKNNIDLIIANIAILNDFFEKHNDKFEFKNPYAGPIGYVAIKDVINMDELVNGLINVGLMILPSSVYAHDEKAFRIGFGRENMKECIEIFDKYLESIK